MVSAYTGYKFKKMLFLVFGIMILLAVLSLLNPMKQEVKDVAVNEIAKVDETGIINESYNTYNDITGLNLKPKAEQKSGNYFLRTLQNNPVEFLFVGFLVSGVLFLFGVRLKSMRGYSSGLQKSIRGW
ncbi:hypothetical protein KAS08_02595 [Candidatus Pacearchaeota archaeon]|nr:hypothetical protein [Candidatus Pacearchaeota archaeon]